MERTVRIHRRGLHPAVVTWSCALTVALAATVAGGCGESAQEDLEIASWGGFLGTYYADLSIEEALDDAAPTLMRTDQIIDFPAARASFGTESGTGRYTVRWQGWTFVPEDQDVRGIVVTGLGRAGLLVDGRVVFRPSADGGLIDERHAMDLGRGWREIELWYENLDRNTHAIRFGWMSANSDLVPIRSGFAGISPDQVPEGPLNLACEAVDVRFQDAIVVVTADSIATLNIKSGTNDVTSEVPISRLQAELIRLEPDTTVTATVTATAVDGTIETATCSFDTPALPVWVEGHWRAEYYDSSELEESAGVRYEPARLAFPDDLPYPSSRTEWFPGAGSNTFSVRWSAWMLLEDEGTYRFAVGSDDGSRVFVNGEQVVDLWRSGSFTTEEGETDLRPGYHEVVLEYYQSSGESRFTWEIGRVDGDRVTPVDPSQLFGEIPEPPDEAPRISSEVQSDLNFDDGSASQWTEAGCEESLDLFLSQAASLELDGELLQLTLDAPATSHALCILPGTESRAQVRLTDLDGNATNWMRVEFERPVEEPPTDGQ